MIEKHSARVIHLDLGSWRSIIIIAFLIMDQGIGRQQTFSILPYLVPTINAIFMNFHSSAHPFSLVTEWALWYCLFLPSYNLFYLYFFIAVLYIVSFFPWTSLKAPFTHSLLYFPCLILMVQKLPYLVDSRWYFCKNNLFLLIWLPQRRFW